MVATEVNPGGSVTQLTHAITEDSNINFTANGAAVLVQLSSSAGALALVDFQTTIDGETYHNIPYVERTAPGAVAVTGQIIAEIKTARLYLLLGPLSQVRIAISGYQSGTVDVRWRLIIGTEVDRQVPRYDYIIRSTEAKPTVAAGVTGLRLLEYDTGRVFTPFDRKWVPELNPVLVTLDEVNASLKDVLTELRKHTEVLEQHDV